MLEEVKEIKKFDLAFGAEQERNLIEYKKKMEQIYQEQLQTTNENKNLPIIRDEAKKKLEQKRINKKEEKEKLLKQKEEKSKKEKETREQAEKEQYKLPF